MTYAAVSDRTEAMKFAAALSVAFCAILALAFALPAGAAEIVTRNAKQIKLATDNQGRAMVSYYQRGRLWHVFYSGAINARAPSQTVAQVKFKVDYSGGRGEWRRFKNTCRPYDGPKLAWFVTACKATDGSYWALQAWQRMLPNAGYVPWKHEQKVWEVHISHWTGELAQIEVYLDWVYGGKFHAIFGRGTYNGKPIYGFKSTSSGVPLDTFGRLVYLDTFGSAYAPGWRRENSFLLHRGSGMFCYGFYPWGKYGNYPTQRDHKIPGNGSKYRLTLSGPGVTPDVMWTGNGLPNFDATDQMLVDIETEMTAKLKEMAATYGDAQCGHH
jgi:hypothetical protein